jgi:hypothetical protein
MLSSFVALLSSLCSSCCLSISRICLFYPISSLIYEVLDAADGGEELGAKDVVEENEEVVEKRVVLVFLGGQGAGTGSEGGESVFVVDGEKVGEQSTHPFKLGELRVGALPEGDDGELGDGTFQDGGFELLQKAQNHV